MYLIMALLAANTCLLVSYVGSSKMDIQDRALEVRLKRVIVPQKWRWMFRFRWSYSGDVLLLALIGEITGLIFAFLFFCFGIVFTLCSYVYARHIMFGTYVLYALLILIYSAAGVIQYEIKKIKKRKYDVPDPFAKKCWSCEFESAVSLKAYHVPCRKVKVLGVQTGEDGQEIFTIQSGRWLIREFYAIASKSYKPVNGVYAKAIYTKKVPYFVLVSDWDEKTTISS